MREAVEIIDGRADPSTYRVHKPQLPDVRAIRAKLGLSQAEFAVRFGFPLDTLRKWEQGTRIRLARRKRFWLSSTGIPRRCRTR
jgi:DNA-binding XRE family transcriptional regulator